MTEGKKGCRELFEHYFFLQAEGGGEDHKVSFSWTLWPWSSCLALGHSLLFHLLMHNKSFHPVCVCVCVRALGWGVCSLSYSNVFPNQPSKTEYWSTLT